LCFASAAYAKDAFYDSILPSLAVSEGDLVLASTPFGKRGFFYQEWTCGAGWERYEVPATECPRIRHKFLEKERRRRGDNHFLQEYMCEFIETEDRVFSDELIARAVNPAIKPLFEEGELEEWLGEE
jgi:hypothetical protein